PTTELGNDYGKKLRKSFEECKLNFWQFACLCRLESYLKLARWPFNERLWSRDGRMIKIGSTFPTLLSFI
ncbi:MAG: hypothetical protein ACRENG_27455, partial [bacterium]